jgi:hypothetical protein
MAFPAFTGGITNLNPSSFVAVYIRQSGGKWQTLGSISSGVLDVTDFTSDDSLKRNKAINSYNFTAKCNMMQCSITELQLLATICNGANDFLFKLSNAVAITGSPVASAGWVGVAAASVGIKGKPVLDGDPSKDRVIELEWQGSIYKTDANEVLLYTPTLQATDFEATGTGGTFHAIGTYTAATDGGSPTNSHLRPCGVSTVTFDVAGGSSPVTITPITDVKLTFESIAQTDGLRRFLPVSLSIDAEESCMATLNADLLLLGNMSATDIKIIYTMLDAMTITLDNKVGIETDFKVSGDMDKNQVARFVHKGYILQSSFSGIFG